MEKTATSKDSDFRYALLGIKILTLLINPYIIEPLQKCEGFLYKLFLNLEPLGYISSHEDLPQKKSDIFYTGV